MAKPTLEDIAGNGSFDPVEAIRLLAGAINTMKAPNTANPSTSIDASTDPFVALLGNQRMANMLHKAGFHSIPDLNNASDEAILAIDGIGQKGLDQIRAKLNTNE